MRANSCSDSYRPSPWYRQVWPWIVMAPPIAAVVAGAVMFWLAVATEDGLVTPDYDRQGIEINRRLTASEAANCAVKDRACMSAPAEQPR